MNGKILGSIVLLSIAFVGCAHQQPIEQQKAISSVRIGSAEVHVSLAQSVDEQIRGLSGVSKLGIDEGKLFVFPSKQPQAFWMKGMLIPIDIIWIDGSRIVGIEKSVPIPSLGEPDGALPIYRSPEPVEYVLEVSAGFSEKFNVKPGDMVEFM